MKKLVIAFGLLAAISMFSCTGSNNEEKQVSESDTIQVVQDTIQQVSGVAVDGANNCITLLVGDDTIKFDYPDLDRDHKDAWYINDSVTVRYYVTQDGDSVIDVINETNA